MCVVKRLEDLFDLPEMAALMRRQHAKGAVHVVAEAGIHGRLNSHLINGKASRRPYGFRKLSLRFFKRTPGRIEVVLTRDQRREHFEPQPVRRLQIPDEQARESAGPQRSVSGKTRSTSDGRRYSGNKCIRSPRQMIQALRHRPRRRFEACCQVRLAASGNQSFGF